MAILLCIGHLQVFLGVTFKTDFFWGLSNFSVFWGYLYFGVC